MSIRNLRGAPTFGESSTLDIHDLGGGGGEGHRRRSQSSRFLPSQYQHVAGEAIGSSYANQTSSSMFSSFRKPRSRTVSHEFVIKSSSSGELEQPPPPPSSPSPSSSLIFRKFRSSTWDATGIPRLSPKGRANPSDQKSLPDAPPFGGSDYPHNNKLDEQGDERKQFALKSVNGRDISDYDIYFDDSSSSESKEYASNTESHMAVQMLDLQPKAPLSSIECLEELESNNLTDNSTNSAVYQVEDTITKNEVADLEKREKRWSMDSSTSETFHGSKKGVTFAKGLTEYEISDNEYEEKNNEALVDKEDDEENSVNHHSSNQRNALPVMNLPSSQRLSYQYSSPQQQYQQQQQQQKFGHFAKLNPASNLSWSLIGSYIVRTAPCFWCMKKLSISATDREILIRLNVLCSFFCIIQIGLGLFLFITSLMGSIEDRDENKNDPNASSTEDFEARPLVSPDLWNLTLFVYMLSIVNAVLLIASVLAQRAIREVNLVGSVKFMWSLLWLLPIQIFLMIGLFDYYRVMEVWIKHWWDDPSMAFFRGLFCEEGTADEECMVPILGGEAYENEAQWCEEKYNSTRCEDIRREAQDECRVASYILFTSNGVWALLLVALIWVTLSVLQGIITMPIVQRSKESNIPLWLTFPIVGCFSLGYLLLYAPTSMTKETNNDLYWMGLTYFISGAAFAMAALVGYFLKFYSVLNRRQKKCKQGVVIFFIVTTVVTIFSVASIFTTSLIYSLNIVELSLETYHSTACMLDFGGSCTGCDSSNPVEVCPEWTESDVKLVLKTIMKQSATVAAIFLVYSLITLRYGFVLFSHVSSYHIEYV